METEQNVNGRILGDIYYTEQLAKLSLEKEYEPYVLSTPYAEYLVKSNYLNYSPNEENLDKIWVSKEEIDDVLDNFYESIGLESKKQRRDVEMRDFDGDIHVSKVGNGYLVGVGIGDIYKEDVSENDPLETISELIEEVLYGLDVKESEKEKIKKLKEELAELESE
ncbi:MAG: hypothetical protein ACOCZ5_02020 [bacterium]